MKVRLCLRCRREFKPEKSGFFTCPDCRKINERTRLPKQSGNGGSKRGGFGPGVNGHS